MIRALSLAAFIILSCPLVAEDEVPSAAEGAHNFLDREGKLRLYHNGEETLDINEKRGGRVLISSAGDNVVRRIYDTMGRLSEREMWSKSKKVCTKKERYSYNAEEAKPCECVIDEEDKITGKWKRIERRYDSGLVIEEKVWEIEVANAAGDSESATGMANANIDSTDKEIRHLVKVVRKMYDGGEIKEVTTTERSADGKKMVVRDVYDGRDTYRYENGVLRMSTVHEGDDCYTKTVVFGEGKEMVKIVTVYKDERKIESKVIK